MRSRAPTGVGGRDEVAHHGCTDAVLLNTSRRHAIPYERLIGVQIERAGLTRQLHTHDDEYRAALGRRTIVRHTHGHERFSCARVARLGERRHKRPLNGAAAAKQRQCRGGVACRRPRTARFCRVFVYADKLLLHESHFMSAYHTARRSASLDRRQRATRRAACACKMTLPVMVTKDQAR